VDPSSESDHAQSMSSSERDGVDIVRNCSALKALASEWEALAKSIGLPMLSHAWVLSCAEALYHEDELHIITVRVRGVLAGVAPLVTEVHGGITRLELIGVSYLYEPSGLLFDTDDALDALARAIVNLRKPVELSRIPADSPIISRLRSVARGRCLVVVGPVAGTVAVPISSGWSEYVARLSPRRRYDLRRARRRAEESGKITVRIHSPGPEDVERMFAEFVRIESGGWKARNGSSLSQRHSLRRFFLHYATRASQSGTLRFGFLDVDGRPIAAQLSVEYSDRLWVLKIGYDEAWSRCSPGWQLLAETMRDAFARKLKSYEFLGSDEPWLHGWATDGRDLCTLVCYPTTLLGLYGLAADTVGRVRDRVASRSRWAGRPQASSRV
jgi:CelD/BcsL family acetyltransferase involved in cellulose biosynthesis